MTGEVVRSDRLRWAKPAIAMSDVTIGIDWLVNYLNVASENDIDALRLYLYNRYSKKDLLLGEQVVNDIREALDWAAVKMDNKKRNR